MILLMRFGGSTRRLEAVFQLPLLGGFVAGLSGRRGTAVGFASRGVIWRRRRGRVKSSGFCQRLGPGRKLCSRPVRAMFLRSVGEVVFERGAGVLVREVDAGDAFVVGGERDGDVRGAVGGKRMIGPVMPRMTSLEVRLISTMTWRSASSLQEQLAGRLSYMTSTPWPMRSAWPRSTASRMWKRRPAAGRCRGRVRRRAARCGRWGRRCGGSRASASGGGTRSWPCRRLRAGRS